jgi:hypothetical protein
MHLFHSAPMTRGGSVRLALVLALVFRLFLVPGVHHCSGGPGLTEFDALTLLENWVEKGQPPDV